MNLKTILQECQHKLGWGGLREKHVTLPIRPEPVSKHDYLALTFLWLFNVKSVSRQYSCNFFVISGQTGHVERLTQTRSFRCTHFQNFKITFRHNAGFLQILMSPFHDKYSGLLHYPDVFFLLLTKPNLSLISGGHCTPLPKGVSLLYHARDKCYSVTIYHTRKA